MSSVFDNNGIAAAVDSYQRASDRAAERRYRADENLAASKRWHVQDDRARENHENALVDRQVANDQAAIQADQNQQRHVQWQEDNKYTAILREQQQTDRAAILPTVRAEELQRLNAANQANKAFVASQKAISLTAGSMASSPYASSQSAPQPAPDPLAAPAAALSSAPEGVPVPLFGSAASGKARSTLVNNSGRGTDTALTRSPDGKYLLSTLTEDGESLPLLSDVNDGPQLYIPEAQAPAMLAHLSALDSRLAEQFPGMPEVSRQAIIHQSFVVGEDGSVSPLPADDFEEVLQEIITNPAFDTRAVDPESPYAAPVEGAPPAAGSIAAPVAVALPTTPAVDPMSIAAPSRGPVPMKGRVLPQPIQEQEGPPLPPRVPVPMKGRGLPSPVSEVDKPAEPPKPAPAPDPRKAEISSAADAIIAAVLSGTAPSTPGAEAPAGTAEAGARTSTSSSASISMTSRVPTPAGQGAPAAGRVYPGGRIEGSPEERAAIAARLFRDGGITEQQAYNLMETGTFGMSQQGLDNYAMFGDVDAYKDSMSAAKAEQDLYNSQRTGDYTNARISLTKKREDVAEADLVAGKDDARQKHFTTVMGNLDLVGEKAFRSMGLSDDKLKEFTDGYVLHMNQAIDTLNMDPSQIIAIGGANVFADAAGLYKSWKRKYGDTNIPSSALLMPILRGLRADSTESDEAIREFADLTAALGSEQSAARVTMALMDGLARTGATREEINAEVKAKTRGIILSAKEARARAAAGRQQ